MDSLDLLAREDEFKKLNKQLEKKTESLMKQIEHAMQKQDIFAEFSPNLTLSPVHTIKKHNCDTHRQTTASPLPAQQKQIQKKKTRPQSCVLSSDSQTQSTKFDNKTQHSDVSTTNCAGDSGPNGAIESSTKIINVCECCTNIKVNNLRGDAEFLYAFVSVNVKDKVLPQSFLKDRPTIENVCKFLSSKVKLMQEQIDKLQATIDKKASQCDAHMTQLAELESERLTLLNKANNMKASAADMKAKCMVLQAKLDEKEKLYKEQRSETDRLTCELKNIKIKCTSVEAKCASQEETIENLKQQIDVVKRSEKEFRESSRSLSASYQNAISRLEAHIKALSTRIERQMALIDNLRRQNVLLNTEGALRVLEKEYTDYLNQDF